MGLPYGSIPRKTVPREDQATAMDYAVLLDFGVRNVVLYQLQYIWTNFGPHGTLSFPSNSYFNTYRGEIQRLYLYITGISQTSTCGHCPRLIGCSTICDMMSQPVAPASRPQGSWDRKSARLILEYCLTLVSTSACHQQGYCKYSFLFYGYYNNDPTIGVLKFRLPLSYLLVGVGIFGYSLMVVIRT